MITNRMLHNFASRRQSKRKVWPIYDKTGEIPMSNYSDSNFANDSNTPWFKVLKLIPDKSKVLDIGCSSGNFGSVLIKEKKAIVDGLELDKGDAKTAGSRLRK